MPKNFFAQQTPASRIKSEIVTKFFDAWTRVILGALKRRGQSPAQVAYVDFFAGPGRYDDGTPSTPLLVLDKALAEPARRDAVLTLFNEGDPVLFSKLKGNVNALPGVEALRTPPSFSNVTVDADYEGILEPVRNMPALFFVDPWGYKGINLARLVQTLEGFGRDLVLFFNYRRICAALGNRALAAPVNEMFSKPLADSLRRDLRGLRGAAREKRIVDATIGVLSGASGYVRTYRFATRAGGASHLLFYVCKDAKGHEIMGAIMARLSTTNDSGVPSFEYDPDPKPVNKQMLFEFVEKQPDPIDALGGELMRMFPGKTLTPRGVFAIHSKTTSRFTLPNYKEALRRLEERGHVVTDPPAEKRALRNGKRSFGDAVRVIFPEKGPP